MTIPELIERMRLRWGPYIYDDPEGFELVEQELHAMIERAKKAQVIAEDQDYIESLRMIGVNI